MSIKMRPRRKQEGAHLVLEVVDDGRLALARLLELLHEARDIGAVVAVEVLRVGHPGPVPGHLDLDGDLDLATVGARSVPAQSPDKRRRAHLVDVLRANVLELDGAASGDSFV